MGSEPRCSPDSSVSRPGRLEEEGLVGDPGTDTVHEADIVTSFNSLELIQPPSAVPAEVGSRPRDAAGLWSSGIRCGAGFSSDTSFPVSDRTSILLKKLRAPVGGHGPAKTVHAGTRDRLGGCNHHCGTGRTGHSTG